MHIVHSAHGRPTPRAGVEGRRDEAARTARNSERVPDRDRTTVRIHVRGIVRKPELAHHGQRLCGKGFVELEHIDVRKTQVGLLEQLARGWDRPDTHDSRGHAGNRARDDARARLEPVLRCRAFARNQERRRPVVDAGREWRRDRSIGLTSPEPRRCSSVTSPRDARRASNHAKQSSRPRTQTGTISREQTPARGGATLPTAQRERVPVGATSRLGHQVLCRLRHRIHVVVAA
jgi:hypothetical protein